MAQVLCDLLANPAFESAVERAVFVAIYTGCRLRHSVASSSSASSNSICVVLFVRLFEPSSHFLPDFMNSLRAHADIVFVHGNVLLDFAFRSAPLGSITSIQSFCSVIASPRLVALSSV
jgi:hypothetical protein